MSEDIEVHFKQLGMPTARVRSVYLRTIEELNIKQPLRVDSPLKVVAGYFAGQDPSFERTQEANSLPGSLSLRRLVQLGLIGRDPRDLSGAQFERLDVSLGRKGRSVLDRDIRSLTPGDIGIIVTQNPMNQVLAADIAAARAILNVKGIPLPNPEPAAGIRSWFMAKLKSHLPKPK